MACSIVVIISWNWCNRKANK